MPIVARSGSIADLRRELEALKGAGPAVAQGELKAKALAAVEEVRRRAPRETGALEAAVYARQARGPGGRFSSRWEVGVDESTLRRPYARYMNDGWVFAGSPFYRLWEGSVAKNRGPAHAEPGGVGLKFFDRGVAAAVGKETTASLASRLWQGVLRTIGRGR